MDHLLYRFNDEKARLTGAYLVPLDLSDHLPLAIDLSLSYDDVPVEDDVKETQIQSVREATVSKVGTSYYHFYVIGVLVLLAVAIACIIVVWKRKKRKTGKTKKKVTLDDDQGPEEGQVSAVDCA